MAKAQGIIYKTANPVGFSWTFDRTDTPDAAIDNAATASAAGLALDSIKALVGALPGTFQRAVINVETFE